MGRVHVSLFAVAFALAALRCIDFDADYARCLDGGACVAADAGGGDDGGAVDAGGPDAGETFDAGTFATCNERGVCWENPLPQGNSLNAVFTFGPGDTWVAGNRGMLAHWDGARWRTFDAFAETEYPLNDLWGRASDGRVWVVGSDTSGVWNGTTWKRFDSVSGVAVAGDPDGGSVWRLAGQGLASTFDFSLNQWSPAVETFATSDLWHSPAGFFGTSGNTVYGPGDPGNKTKFPDRALTRTLRGGGSVEGADWILGDFETLYLRADAGFTEVRSGEAEAAYGDLWVERADKVWLVGSSGRVVRYDHADGGIEDLAPGLSVPALTAVHGSDPQNVWVVGAEGVILHHDGKEAGRLDEGVRLDLARVRAVNGRQLAVGTQGTLMKRSADGWKRDDAFSCSEFVEDAWLGPSGEVLALCYGEVYAGTFGGTSWSRDTAPEYLLKVWASAPDHAFAMTASEVLQRHGTGVWEKMPDQPGAGPLALLWGTPGQDRLYVLTRAGAVLSRSEAGTWETLTTIDGGTADFDPYVALSDGERSWMGGYPNTFCLVEADGEWRCERGFKGVAIVDLALCGEGGLCALSTDGLYVAPDRTNPTWTELRLGNEPTARGLAIEGGAAWIAGDRGMILRVDLP